MTLTFNPRNHSYRLDKRPVPGVTTLLKNGLPKPALTYWAARTVAEFVADHPDIVEAVKAAGGRAPAVAMLKEVPFQRRDEAAIRGTDVHALAEQIVHGREVDVPEHLAGYVQGYIEWLDGTDLEPVLTERPVASRQWGFAGTFDLIATMTGETWLLDIKTAKGVYGDNLLQLAAYAGAEFYLDADGNEQPLPPIDRLGVLHVQDGLTELYPADPDDAAQAWKHFLHVQWVGRNAKTIDGYLSTPQAPTDEDEDAA